MRDNNFRENEFVLAYGSALTWEFQGGLDYWGKQYYHRVTEADSLEFMDIRLEDLQGNALPKDSEIELDRAPLADSQNELIQSNHMVF